MDTNCKKCRRERSKLFLKGERCFTAKCAIIKRNFPPGMHGDKRHGRLSGYGIQLREKQKAKRIYGIREQQFKKYYASAYKQKGKSAELMLQLLERRLDNVVFRAGLANSRQLARQMVTHGHFLVKERSVNIPSFQVSVGDVITVKPQKKKAMYWQKVDKNMSGSEVPGWLEANYQNLSITVKHLPSEDLIKTELQTHLIIEYYSR